MNMAELVEMLKARQGDMSIEVYANKMDIRGATLYRYYSQERSISLSSIRKMAQYFHCHGDMEMVQALGAYALNLDIPAPSLN
jgi:hypothetical protein